MFYRGRGGRKGGGGGGGGGEGFGVFGSDGIHRVPRFYDTFLTKGF